MFRFDVLCDVAYWYLTHAADQVKYCYMRTLLVTLILLFTAQFTGAHEVQTYPEFEIREDIMRLQINYWELVQQLEYANPELRLRVYEEIADILQELRDHTAKLLEIDSTIHAQDPH